MHSFLRITFFLVSLTRKSQVNVKSIQFLDYISGRNATMSKQPENTESIGTTLNDETPDAKSTNILEAKPLDSSNKISANPHIPSVSASAVLGESSTLPDSTPKCKGPDFNSMTSENMLDQIMESFKTTGFQSTNLGLAVEQIQKMREWRLSDVEWKEGDDPALMPPEVRNRLRARIFLAYTSNQISSGQREVLRFLVQNKMVDVIVTTAGGIEEDIIKCFQPTFMGDFKLNGRELRKKGINRIGNLLVPNKVSFCLPITKITCRKT